jgi:hypothetical protein
MKQKAVPSGPKGTDQLIKQTTTKESLDDKPPKAPTMPEKKKEEDDHVRLTDEGLQIPVGNGGSTKRYKWTQTIDETSVLIGIPGGLHGKDLEVTIKTSSLQVRTKKPLKGEDSPRTFLEGTLTQKIVPDESTWSLEGGVLVLVLCKKKKSIWETVLEGDEKIDTTLVDNRRHISEYDEATQAQIRKIIFDQNQAHKGLPSSDEISGKMPTIPPTLPPGVEYIDQKVLDEHAAKGKESK